MRKNRTKHEAKKPRLAKRALALCFALIFVCSCLLPVFAHSEENLLMQEPVAQQESVDNPTEGGEQQSTDNLTEGGEQKSEPNLTEGNEQKSEPNLTEGNEQKSEPKTEETKPEGTTEESKDTAGETKTEETKPAETKPEEPKQPTTNTTGDTINQGEAVYTYRFWTKEIDAFDLEQVNQAVNNGENLIDAAKSVTGIAPCEVLKVANHAHLADYTVTEPTKDGYEFAGWYTLENGTAYEFSFDQNVSFEQSKTIDVFAKWEKVEAEVKQVELGGKNVSVEVEDAPALTVSQPSDTVAEELGKKVLARIDWDKFNTLYMFDLEPKNNDGLAIDSAKKVTISGLNIDSSEDVKVFHLGANFEEVPAEVSADGTLTFTPSSFSPFAIALADDSVASYPEQDDDRAYFGEDYIMLADEAAYDYTVQEGNTISVTGQSADYHTHKWSSSNANIATVSGNSETVTVTGVKAGTATLTHICWDENWAGILWLGWTEKKETKAVKVTPKEYANQNADIFFLKTPTSSAGSNDTSQWLPQNSAGGSLTGWTINGINMDGEINVTGAKWDSQDKNIVLSGQDKPVTAFIKKWPDGTTDGVWKLYRKCPENYTGTNSSLNEATFGYVLRNIWEAYKSQLETDLQVNNLNQDLISEITLTPYKISKNDTMHIDCTISVTGLACTAKFHVEPAGDVGYQQVFGKNYSSTQNVAEPSATELSSYKQKNPHDVEINAEGIPKTRNVHGVNYTFAGWYPEDGETGKPDLSAQKVDFNYTNYTLTKTDMERGVVNFYARYVPDQTVDGPDDPYITVEKKIVGLSKDKVDELVKNFTVKVGNNIELKAQIGNHNYERGNTELTPNGWETTLRWKIDRVVPDSYLVTEKGYTVNGYTLKEKVGDGETFDVENATFDADADVVTTNRDKEFTVGEVGTQYWVFVASLTNRNNVVISSRPLSAQERAAIVNAVRNKNKGTISNKSTLQDSIFYSITEGRELELKDDKGQEYKITYNDNKIRIEAKEMWNMVAKVSYSMTDAPSADIKLTNKYTPATTSLTVTKTATKDGVEDITTAFNFTLTLGEKSLGATWTKGTDHGTVEGTSHNFTLKGGESITFNGIRLDDTNVKVEEIINDNHYTTTNTVDSTASPEGKVAKVTPKSDGNTVVFTNAYTTPKLPSMTIHKKVTGAFGERTKEFAFSVKLENADCSVEGIGPTSFKLMHGQQVELKNIPINTTITITESNANDYKTSATGHNGYVSGSNARTFTYKVEEEGGKAVLKSEGANAAKVANNAITVENDFDGTPDTGVLLDTLPYLILLAVAVAGGVLVVVRKRKHRDE